MTVASPGYLARKPAPTRPADLAEHTCLRFLAPNGKPRAWSFAEGDRTLTVPVTGNLVIDNGSALLEAAGAGMGICQVLDFMVEPALRTGALTEVLAGVAAQGPKIHAVATPSRSRPASVRAFMRFWADAFRVRRARDGWPWRRG